MGWFLDQELYSLELDDACKEEVSGLLVRCSVLNRKVVVASRVPWTWVVYARILGGLFGTVLGFRCALTPLGQALLLRVPAL